MFSSLLCVDKVLLSPRGCLYVFAKNQLSHISFENLLFVSTKKLKGITFKYWYPHYGYCINLMCNWKSSCPYIYMFVCMSISIPYMYGSISTSSIDPLVYLNFSVTMSYNYCSFLFFILFFPLLYYVHVIYMEDCIYMFVYVRTCRGAVCMYSGRPKVVFEIHPQLLFHIIHWVMVSSAWQNLLVGLVLVASLLWGSLPPPSKTEITGGRYALLACKWVLRLRTLILILEPWVL